MNCDEFPDVMEKQEIPHRIPRLDADVIAGWKWWLGLKHSKKTCPMWYTDRDKRKYCNEDKVPRFCTSIFTDVIGKGKKAPCPCYHYDTHSIRAIVKKVLAAQKPFVPYAAVRTVDCSVPACGTASHRVGSVFIVTGDICGSYLEGDDVSHCKNYSIKITNPTEARDRLIELHGNPGADAVLDELAKWVNQKLFQVDSHNYRVNALPLLTKIASFRKSPKPALDEDAIRADERKKVFRDVITLVESYRGHTSKHTVDNILFDLGTIAKGGDEE